MYLIIIKNGTVIDHRKQGLKLLSFKVDSLSHRTEWQEIDGRHGSIDMGTTFDIRKPTAVFLLQGEDHLDYNLLISEAYELFSTEDEIEIIDSRQPGKVWSVKVSSVFEPEDITPRSGKLTIEFTAAFPFASSLGSTLDPLTFDSDKWQVAQGMLPSDDLSYRHKTTHFRIYNAGNVTIDPSMDMPLNIQYKGASNNLVIRNKTSNQAVSYTKKTGSSDVIKFEGLRHLKNGISIYADTNRGYINLLPGWNTFELTGTMGSFEIEFDFYFFYRG
ncbi:phage tail family protein [Bacillus amyloliquefaciens]|uniref:phage tail family protein n=1 Tax=Bacillus amyloliquefaciens TaxID=1390 RepID=UPI002DB979B5|nr:phage tail family protein [Bacillus amyloliquefaciens]MEC3841574.1 phage tail family protein [Bacillus amyloliquefaciens]